jgi:hypothetical protein
MEYVEPEESNKFLGDMMMNSSGEKKRLKVMRQLEELEQGCNQDVSRHSVRSDLFFAKYTRIPQLTSDAQFFTLINITDSFTVAKKL